MHQLKRAFLFIITLFVTLFLISCASQPPPVQLPEGWELQKQQLENYVQWQIKGKLAYKRNEDGFSANINWIETELNNNPTTKLRLFNPLGITLVELNATPNVATLEADDQFYQDSNINALLLRVTGWDIPVDQLRRWIKALPNEGDRVLFNDDGTIATLTPQLSSKCDDCNKWQINYLRYTSLNDLVLPTSIVITDTTQTNAFIKLRISSWR